MTTTADEKRNYRAFLWHAGFLALTITFTDINTIMPSLIVKAGGTEVHLGILTAVMIGTPILGELLFASYLYLKPRKKTFLLLGINTRVLLLIIFAALLRYGDSFSGMMLIALIIVLMLLFSVAGTFAGISYTDILGKSITGTLRQRYFVRRQVITSSAFLLSALAARHILVSFAWPDNYFVLFALAAGLLFVASLGFWVIRERPVQAAGSRRGFLHVLRSIPATLRQNPALKNYIIMNNLTGFGLALLPFYISLAKKSYGLTGEQVGAYLLLQYVGMILSNVLWARVVRMQQFQGVSKGCVLIGAALPVVALGLSHLSFIAFLPVFFFMGFSLSARRIGFDGLFLEITDDENRALHKGIVGATSLTVAFFPLLAGWLITRVGFVPVFLFSSLMIASSYFALNAICTSTPKRP